MAKSNLRIVNYLNVTLNNNDSSFKPYHKRDDSIQYINKESNHPLNFIKHLPTSVKKRLLNHSSDKAIFEKSAIYNEDRLIKQDT